MFAQGPTLPSVATLPSASSNQYRVLVQGKKLWYSDGSVWIDLGSRVYKKSVAWAPAGNSTTITVTGAAALVATGTVTAANVAITNIYTYQKRVEALVTNASSSAVAAFRAAAALWARGAAADQGGFVFYCRFGPATGVATATARCFVGMSNSVVAPTDVQPSSLINAIGVGWDSTDANIQIMHNDGAGVATKINLGVSFPVPTVDRSKVYDLRLTCTPNSSLVTYEFRDVGTGAIAIGVISTDLPSGITLLAPRGYMSVGGTSSVIGIALMELWIDSDY